MVGRLSSHIFFISDWTNWTLESVMTVFFVAPLLHRLLHFNGRKDDIDNIASHINHITNVNSWLKCAAVARSTLAG